MGLKVTFYSNFMNNHQLPLSVSMLDKGIEYTFVATEPFPKERIDSGYEDMNKKYPFILTTYDSKENYEKAIQLARESDIVILGSAPEIYIKERMKLNKITFRYSERFLRKGLYQLLNPKLWFYMLKNNTIYYNKPLYLLSASAFSSRDFSLVGAFYNKAYKWGYFPKVEEYEIDELIEVKDKNQKIKIVWCARFISLKHPELMIELANRLKEEKYKFEIIMIGGGPLFEEIRTKIKDNNLEDCISCTGPISSDEVMEHMKTANIFTFTSDKNEGWGAVLNEAMNAACAVVVSHRIGSVPFLINHNINGLIYEDGNFRSFYERVKFLIDNKDIRYVISKEAHKTISSEWNAKNAAEKLLILYNNLKEKNGKDIINGVCSKAEIIKEDKKLYNKLINKEK